MPRRYVYLIVATVISGGLAVVMGAKLVERPSLAVLLVFFPAGVFFVRFLRDNSEWVRIGAEGSAALVAGRFDAAYALFERAEQQGVTATQRAVNAYDRGAIRILQGRIEEALTDLDRADQRRRLRRNVAHYDRTLPSQRALCLAMLGRLDDAARAKEEGAQRRGSGPVDVTTTLVEALLLARGGRPAEALAWIDAHWVQLDAGSGWGQRLARVLQAWSLHSTGGDAARITRLLHAAAPLNVPEVATLAGSWPELKTFLSPSLVEVA